MIRVLLFFRPLLCVPPLRRQLALTVVVWCAFGVIVLAEAEEGHGMSPSALFTWQNVISGLILVYHLGMVRAQFMSLQERVTKLEDQREEDLKRWFSLMEGKTR